MARRRYTMIVAPIAEAQIDAALLWWSRYRRAAPDLLARDLEAAFRTIEYVPQAGRRTRSRMFRDVRRLLLRGTGYHLYYRYREVPRPAGRSRWFTSGMPGVVRWGESRD